MSIRPKDPLLTAARLVIGVLIAFGVIGLVALSVALPGLLLNQEKVLAELAKEGATVGSEIFGAFSIMLLSAAAFVALGIWFLVILRRIVNTVGDGDPFVPENADRLAKMGWIALAAQGAAIPLGAMAMWIGEALKNVDGVTVDGDYGISVGALILILVLFILARVFRHGAAMRDDLEGTV